MRKEGQITVFLSLVLVCVLGLLCGLLESARMAGSAYYLQMAANSAVQSVFGAYNLELWNRYRILGLWADEEDVEQEFRNYLTFYLNHGTFYPSQIRQIQGKEIKYLTDANGRYFEQEILDYMKYGIWTLDMKPEEAESVFDGMMDSFSADELSDSWKSHMKSAERLEQALEAIMECHRKQIEHREDGIRFLREGNGGGFVRSAKVLIREANKMPSLVKQYEGAAENLKLQLDKTKKEMAGKMEETTGAEAAFLNELEAYETYVDADGDRRKR